MSKNFCRCRRHRPAIGPPETDNWRPHSRGPDDGKAARSPNPPRTPPAEQKLRGLPPMSRVCLRSLKCLGRPSARGRAPASSSSLSHGSRLSSGLGPWSRTLPKLWRTSQLSFQHFPPDNQAPRAAMRLPLNRRLQRRSVSEYAVVSFFIVLRYRKKRPLGRRWRRLSTVRNQRITDTQNQPSSCGLT